MNIPRMSMITLGVQDLKRAAAFYRQVFGIGPNPAFEEHIAFFQLPAVWLTLYPLEKLAEDIGPSVRPERSGFSGVTLAHNVRSREEVLAVFAQAEAAGASIVKPPADTFWGGFSGYFADPDGYHWEIAWGPMFAFDAQGDLHFKS